jgi:hypothetical protein
VVIRQEAAVVAVIKSTIKASLQGLLPSRAQSSTPFAANLAKSKAMPLASASLQALTAAALALPGLTLPMVAAASEEEVSFQYGHYQESSRQLFNVNSHLKPIEVESLQGSARVKLTDRVKFAFNYIQDTWSGATPISTAPLSFGENKVKPVVSGASPILMPGTVYLDKQLQPLMLDPVSGKVVQDAQLVHTLSTASPETRKQGDFKLGYDWDEAGVEAGGGISLENDYESRFGNLGGYLDFNQKLTRLNLGLSYTNSDTQALLDHDAAPYIYETSSGFDSYNTTHRSSQLEKAPALKSSILRGNREDWATVLGLTQVLNKKALIEATLGYTRGDGYMANPYKTVTTVFVDPAQVAGVSGVLTGTTLALLEKRPDERNQWTANLRYVQQVDALDAALHLDYRLFHDDWGITAHTFEADWAQPLADGWMVTPRIRYYSQDAADFYHPYLVTLQTPAGKFLGVDSQNNVIRAPLDSSKLPAHYSSDQRLSAFGALSGGVTVSKQFAKGISLEAGAEYYTHAGSLMLGGAGEGAYADFDYYMVNGALKVDLDALALAGSKAMQGEHAGHHQQPAHHHGSPAPAGVMFGHTLGQRGDMMAGYRYMYSFQGGAIQQGVANVSDRTIIDAGCNGKSCYVAPSGMNMHMHMLDLMVAPTDWLTLMLMPQFLDMTMSMRPLSGAPNPLLDSGNATFAAVQHSAHPHNTGGIGDTGLYAMFKLFDVTGHHVHANLGLSAPTGDVGIQLRNTHGENIGFIHYGMQLGSGTWDFKPSLTYTGEQDRWSWGAQLSGTARLENQNSSGFAYGDIFQGTAWGSYSVLNWLNASVRGVYTLQGTNTGAYNGAYTPIGPMDYAGSYGGRYWDVGFGLSAIVPSGDLQGNRLSFEWLQPVHDDVNGYQLPREGALSATWGYAF